MSHFVTFCLLLFSSLISFAGPARTTYQAKIIKPDGYPLEATSVNFKFTILDPSGACILYSETYSAVNMASTGGLISFSLGSGVKTYPVSSPTFADVFSNITPSLSCDAGGQVSYSPAATDTRKIVMQFHDGVSGWQTLPAMNINAVPYAMYADSATSLSGKTLSDLVQVSTLPTCAASEALRYNGTSFSCIAAGGSGTVTSGTVITALGYTPADGVSVTTLTSNLATVSSSVATVNSTIASVSSTVFSVSSTVSALNSTVTALNMTVNAVSASVTALTATVNSVSSSVSTLSGVVNGLATSLSAVVSSQWASSGSAISYSSGHVGIGTSAPTVSLDILAATTAEMRLKNSGNNDAHIFMDANRALSDSGVGSIRGFWDAKIITAIDMMTGLDTTNKDEGYLQFKTRGSGDVTVQTRMTITQSGTVGIGTTVPSALLHLAAAPPNYPALKLTSSTLLASPASGAIEYDGFGFYITDGTNTRRSIATTTAAGTYDNAQNITATSNITLAPSGSVVVSSTAASTNSATGALVVAGGLGVAGQINASGSITTSSVIQGASLTATTGLITPRIWGSTTAGANLYLDSTTHSTKGYVLIGNTGGNVGMGTNMPLAKLYVDSDGLTPNNPIAGTVAVFDNESSDMGIALMTAMNRKASYFFGTTNMASRGAISYTMSNQTNLDKLSFDTNFTSRMQITGSGTVGIGMPMVSAPTAMLQVVNNDLNQDGLLVKAAPSQSAHWLRFNDSNDVTRGYFSPNGGMPTLRLGVTNTVGLVAEYGGINEIPVGASLNSSGHLGIFNTTGTAGAKVMTGYFNGTQFFSAWEIANVGSGMGSLLLMKSGGYVGVGVSTPTARLHLASGTTTNASLKFTSGTLLTSPQAGAVEYDGLNFYITDGSGTRRTIVADNGTGTFAGVNTLSSLGNMSLVPTSSVIVSSTAASTNADTGALIVKGGLGVAGNIYSSGTIVTSANIQGSSITATSGVSTTVINGVPYLALNPNSGNVSVGNDVPTARLTVKGSGNTSATAALSVVNSLSTNMFSVLNDGSVGIGTNVPETKLDIRTGSISNGQINVESNTSNSTVGIDFSHASGRKGFIGLRGAGSSAPTPPINLTYYLWSDTFSAPMIFGTNNTERMRISSAGLVGIGTTSATEKLTVNGGEVYVRSNSSSNNAVHNGIKFSTDDDAYAAAIRAHRGASAGTLGLSFMTANSASETEVMRLTPTGYLGIGVSAPTVKLQVGITDNNSVLFGNSDGVNSNFRFLTKYTDGYNYIQAGVGPSDTAAKLKFSRAFGSLNLADVRFLSDYASFSGNLGVGTTSATHRLQLNSGTQAMKFDGFSAGNSFTSQLTGSDFGSFIEGADNGQFVVALRDNDNADGFRILSGGGNYMSDAIYDTPVFTALSSGYVGIGTATPTSRLEVSGTGYLLKVAGNSSATVAADMIIQRSSTAKLVGRGAAIQFDDTSNNNNNILIQQAQGDLQFFNNSSGSWVERFTIVSGGAVGIGITAPTAALEVKSKALVSNLTNGSMTNIASLNSEAVNGAYLHLRRDGTNEWFMQADAGASNSLHIRHGNVTNLPDLTINTAGNVGIGTSAPAARLTIGGLGATNATAFRIDSQDTYYRDIFMSEFNTTSYGGILRYHSGNDLLQLITVEAGVEKYGVAVARATGFVGIGMNSAAQYQLDVNGDIRISGTPYRAGGDIAWTVPSDARLKDVVGQYNRGLNEILNIDTIVYRYKKDNIKDIDSTKEYSGVLAQQVQTQIPEAVKVDKDGFLSLNTTPIFWAMVNAIKEVYHELLKVMKNDEAQSRAIASVQEENAAIKAENVKIKQENAAIKAYLCAKDPAAPICK